jgi:hypothetical protein
VINIYDDDTAQKRYEAVNQRFRSDIESAWDRLKRQ